MIYDFLITRKHMHAKTRMHMGFKTAELKCIATHNIRKKKKEKMQVGVAN